MNNGIIRGFGRRRGGIVTWLLAFSLGLAGCERENAGEVEAGPAVFPGSSETLDGLALQVLESLVGGDTMALAQFRLTEEEHNTVVWPELPASRAEVGFPVDLAWENIERRNRSGLARSLPVFTGLDLSIESVQCRGGTQEYTTFHVLTDCWTIFEVEGGEGPYQAQPFKDVLVRGGGHKIFRYYETRPTPLDVRTAG